MMKGYVKKLIEEQASFKKLVEGGPSTALGNLLIEGLNLTRRSQEVDAQYYGDPDHLDKVFLAYNFWSLKIRDFLKIRNIPDYLSGFFFEADSVLKIKGGVEYRNISSQKSQELLKNIRTEASKKLEKLRQLRAGVGAQTTKTENGPISAPSVPEIYYNKTTGIGYANGHRFKFKNDQPEYSVFGEMFAKINKPIERRRVLELSGLNEDENNGLEGLANNPRRKSSSHTIATYFINDLAKEVRKRTKLNKDQMVNNNGVLTLVGKVLKNPPNLP